MTKQEEKLIAEKMVEQIENCVHADGMEIDWSRWYAGKGCVSRWYAGKERGYMPVIYGTFYRAPLAICDIVSMTGCSYFQAVWFLSIFM